MASLNGVTIKSLKQFMGNEGPAFQGNVYLNGKKIAFWSQDGNGCPIDDFDFVEGFSEDKFRSLIESTHQYKAYDGTMEPMSAEIFMGRLLDIIYDEKDYKSLIKQGYGYSIKAESEYAYNAYGAPAACPEAKAVDAAREAFLKEVPPAMQEGLHMTVYRSLEDFNVGEPFDLAQIRK